MKTTQLSRKQLLALTFSLMGVGASQALSGCGSAKLPDEVATELASHDSRSQSADALMAQADSYIVWSPSGTGTLPADAPLTPTQRALVDDQLRKLPTRPELVLETDGNSRAQTNSFKAKWWGYEIKLSHAKTQALLIQLRKKSIEGAAKALGIGTRVPEFSEALQYLINLAGFYLIERAAKKKKGIVINLYFPEIGIPFFGILFTVRAQTG